MTVGAAAVEVLDRTERLRLRGMAAAVVATIANARHAGLQQLWVAGAVRFVAIGAILHDRRGLPNVRIAAVRGGAPQDFACRAFHHPLWTVQAPGVLAAAAKGLVLAVKHVCIPPQFGP